jgi:hypothetical protein
MMDSAAESSNPCSERPGATASAREKRWSVKTCLTCS